MKMMKNVFFFRASRYEADTMNGKCSNTMGERREEREKFRRLIAARFYYTGVK